jgi:hypothetical protein
MARFKSPEPNKIIEKWIRNRMTIEYPGLWKTLNNPDFKPLEFEEFRKEAEMNTFLPSPQKWARSIGAIGIISRPGKDGRRRRKKGHMKNKTTFVVCPRHTHGKMIYSVRIW